MKTSTTPPRVEMRDISKRFGDVAALRQVTFAVRRGEIHALLGENGAGKTTLMNILSGLYRADAGTLWIDGRPASIATPREALGHHIGMVHQHVELVPHLSTLENILLGREGSRGWLRLDQRRNSIEDLARRVGLAVDLRLPAEGLGIGAQQKVEILRAMYRGADVLILDEPTTVLTPQEVDGLFATVRALVREGLTVIFITHKIKEVVANCDRVTIMRAGTVVGTLEQAAATPNRLVAMMMGERPPIGADSRPRFPAAVGGPPLLLVEDLSVKRPDGIRGVSRCSFVVAPGEMVGLAGVAGNGQRELAEALVGLLPVASGRIELAGQEITRAAIRDRIARGLLHIPEDRLDDGLLPSRSVAENLSLGLHPYLYGRHLFTRPAIMRAFAQGVVAEYGIATRNVDALAANLSGGNIQKLLVARAMALSQMVHGKVLVALNPTRGLDVQATEFIRRRLVEFTKDGGGVLLVSADLDELIELCDRILVMYRGQIVGDMPRPEFDLVEIGHLMAGTPGATRA
jgi:simple sugar transport system ATP-binding protein